MADEPVSDEPETEADWPLRPWLLAALLALGALLVHIASDDMAAEAIGWRMALTAFAFFGPLALAFTIEREREVAASVFAGVVGLVMAGIAWRVTGAGEHYADESYWLGAGVLSIALAVPLFQADFHRRRFAIPYREIHFHVWSDALSGAGALAFTGVSWALLFILDQLFQLVGIDVIERLMRDGGFNWMFSGAAFGAGLGTLRNQLKILGTLQSVAMLVLSILAVPLALGLLVFLVALILTGGQALWNATDSATPVLLSCAIGAFVLGNAILRDGDDEMTGNRVLRIAALVLCLAILPLTVFAAISMGVRVSQYGLSPERLWGLTAVAVAIAYGLAYLVAVIRGRKAGWREFVRRANLHLAVTICGVALILALPIFDFGAVSARNQEARLEAGKVAPDAFDFSALRWDFGDGGRDALARLAKSSNAKVAGLARRAQAETERSYLRFDTKEVEKRDERLANLRFEVADPAIREALTAYVRGNSYICDKPCVAIDLQRADNGRPILVIAEEGRTHFVTVEQRQREGTTDTVAVADSWQTRPAAVGRAVVTPQSKVEIRPWSGRRVYVDGEPIGEPFD